MTHMAAYLEEVASVLRAIPAADLDAIADRLWEAYHERAHIFACGNGGSSATASHFVEDLSKGIEVQAGRPRFRAISLVDSVAILTAYGNDVGFEHIFSEPLRNLVCARDVLIAVSCSGRSANVIRAMEVARQAGATVIAWTGRDGGDMKALADICLVVPSQSMQQIEDAHLVVAHAVYLDLKHRVEKGTAA